MNRREFLKGLSLLGSIPFIPNYNGDFYVVIGNKIYHNGKLRFYRADPAYFLMVASENSMLIIGKVVRSYRDQWKINFYGVLERWKHWPQVITIHSFGCAGIRLNEEEVQEIIISKERPDWEKYFNVYGKV